MTVNISQNNEQLSTQNPTQTTEPMILGFAPKEVWDDVLIRCGLNPAEITEYNVND